MAYAWESSTPGGQRRVSGPLELQLQVIANNLTWALGLRLASSARGPNHWAVSTAWECAFFFLKGKISLSQSHTPLAVAFEVLWQGQQPQHHSEMSRDECQVLIWDHRVEHTRARQSAGSASLGTIDFSVDPHCKSLSWAGWVFPFCRCGYWDRGRVIVICWVY